MSLGAWQWLGGVLDFDAFAQHVEHQYLGLATVLTAC